MSNERLIFLAKVIKTKKENFTINKYNYHNINKISYSQFPHYSFRAGID